VKFGLYYDLRNPAHLGRAFGDFYAQIIDQVVLGESLGFDEVWISEHHFFADGYTPSPLIWAAALGGRTTRLRVGTNLLVLPLHHPLRIAEDAATISLLTGGRFDLGVGGGYREQEFRAFGRELRHRPSLLEEGIDVIRRAWRGEEMEFTGSRHEFHGVTVAPTPEHSVPVFMGGMATPAIERAAAIADGFLATAERDIDIYVGAMDRLGRLEKGRVLCSNWVIVAEDPEKEWARVGSHVLYQVNDYISHGAFGPDFRAFTRPDDILAAGLYTLRDGPETIREYVALARRYPQIEQFVVWTVLPGEDVSAATDRMIYLADAVIPVVNRELSLPPSPSEC
jgi:alkanesulfonate monooxygenase SsuD/methylene tetrahydromethanopterin reductase-like flavin-dependent oxidoreductase (luciferase family)